jgi:quercetin dioxygenase-like cupin family protein
MLAMFFAAPALAGECPPGKAGANALPDPPTKPVGVVDKELSSISLAKEKVSLQGRRLRFRHMEIAPGGIVPVHDHADRPALIMVNQGEVLENSSQCQVPIVHKAGEVAREYFGVRHWWRNAGSVPVVLTIADIVNDGKPDTMMQQM